MMVTIVLTPPPTILGSNTLTSTKGYGFRSPTYSVVNGIAPFTYALTSTAVSRPGNATTGITFDTPTMTLRVSTAVDTGTYSETITVTDSKGALSSYVIALSVKDPVALAGTTSITKTYGELTQQAYTVTGGTGAYSFLGSNANGTNFCAPIIGTTSTYTYEEIVSVGACNWLSPTGSGNISADYVVAAGGGGGGSSRGGGGGGGGVAYGTGLTLAPSTIYPIGVGAGGAGATTEGYGYNGGNSWISTSDGSAYQVAAGGGGGGAAWTGSGNNGGTGVTAPTATVKSAAGNGGGASPNYQNGSNHDFLGGSGGTGGNFTAYSGGNSYKCTDTSQKEDGQASSSSGRVTGGGGGAGGNGGGQTVNGGTATCWVYSATGSAIPNGGAAYSTSLTGNTLYFGGGGGGSDGRSSTLSEYGYGSTGRGLGTNGGGNGEQPDVYTGGVATNAKIISALPGSAATDNSGGGGGAGLGNGYAGGSGAIVLRYPMPTTRVLNAMSLNTVSNTNGSGAVLLTIPENVTAGSKVETISVSSGGGAATLYTVNITINKATPTVSLTLPGNVATAKYGNAVTIYASATTDGTLAFSDSGTAIAGCASAATTSGVATCTWTPTVIGTRNITATFTPTDATDYNNATSSAFSVVVGKADTLTVDAGDETFTYTGSAPIVLKPFTYLGLVSIDTLTAVGMIYTGTANDGTVINQKTAPILAGTYTSTPDTTVAGVSMILNNYVAISLITGTLTINRATPALSLVYANSNAITYSPTATLDTVTASRSGTGAKSFSSITPVNCSVDSATARMTVLQAGYCQIVMSVVQDPNYLAATVTDSITISKATRTIALTATVSTLKYYDTTTVTTTLSGGATDGAITYSLNATPGCSFDSLGAILTATSGTLACTLNATIAEGTNYLTASTTSPLNLTIAKANAPVITISTVSAVDYVAGTRAQIAPQYTVTGFKGTDNWSSLTLTYTFVSNPFETFSYSDTNTPIDAGTYSITPSALTLSSGLLSNYQTPAYASSSINFTINRIVQAPIFIDNVNGEVITPFTLSIRGGSNATGTSSFAVVSGAGCSISGNVLTATTAGQCLIRGTLSAGRNYLAVTSDTTTVRVRSYTLIPVFTFVGNPNTAISLAGATPLTKGSSTCTSGCVPTLTLATPSSGYPGDVIILTGTQFTGVTGVLFNVFTPAITFNADSDTQITVQVPAGLVTNSNDSIEVVTPGGISSRNFDIFTVLP
jgi:hypothetical protein